VFLEPSCVGPPTLSCRVVSHMTGDSRSSRHGPPMKFFSPFDDLSCGKRPAPGIPLPTVLRPQVFSTSRRVIPSTPFRPYFMPIPSRFSPSESPPNASLVCLSAPSAPLAVLRPVQRTHRLSSRDLCSRQVRTILFGVTRSRWPLLSWCLPLRGFPRSVSTPLQASPLMGFHMMLM
jgi:hypothetical protein